MLLLLLNEVQVMIPELFSTRYWSDSPASSSDIPAKSFQFVPAAASVSYLLPNRKDRMFAWLSVWKARFSATDTRRVGVAYEGDLTE